MNVPRWLAPKTNPALYTALASIALSVWQAVQVDFWRGSLTLPEVGRVAAPIVIAALAAWARGKTTPVADPRDGNGDPLVKSKPAPMVAAMQSLTARQPVDVPPASGPSLTAMPPPAPPPPAQPPAASKP